MKKRCCIGVLTLVAIAVVVMIAVLPENKQTSLFLMNVEALARGEDPSSSGYATIDILILESSETETQPCPNGLPQVMVVCYNVVETVTDCLGSGYKSCTKGTTKERYWAWSNGC